MSRGRVLAALSGGVDSSVAAHLLCQRGYEVIGVFLRNGVEAPAGACRPRQGCCSADDARDAALVAHQLGIPFHALDMQEEFTAIQEYFRDAYRRAHTPNPCAVCNRDIKFGALARFADALGADFLATGHYARLRNAATGGVELWRAADPRKDQSYVLFPVPERILARTLFPIGDLEKTETRAIAAAAGLRVAAKPDSQEICFVPTGDYRDKLRAEGGLGRPGRFVALDGTVLGNHDGYMGFTRGQRRGLRIAAGEPLYVVDVDPDSGDVLLGPLSATGCSGAEVVDFHGFGAGLEPGESWDDVEIQYRSSPGGVPGRVECRSPGGLAVEFATPARSVNPGQGLAVYRGGRLLGGGWIERVTRAAVGLTV